MDPADYVLRRFTKEEREDVDLVVEVAADAVEAVVRHGIEAAKNLYNGWELGLPAPSS